MFEMSAWCYAISVVLAARVWLDARRHQPIWRLPAGAWAVVVALTWVAIVPYAIARLRRPAVAAAR